MSKLLDLSGLTHYDEKIKSEIKKVDEVYIGTTPPTDTNYEIWINPDEQSPEYLSSGDNVSELVNDAGYLTEVEFPTIQFDPSQVISLSPVTIQLTNEQYQIVEDNIFIYVDATLLGMEIVFIQKAYENSQGTQIIFINNQGDAYSEYTVNKSLKQVSYQPVSLQRHLTAGQNITISNNVISATGGGQSEPPTVVLTPSQIISLDPIRFQLTDAQYNTITSNKLFYADVSQLGMDNIFFMLHYIQSISSNSTYYFSSPHESGTDMLYVYSNKIAQFSQLKFVNEPPTVVITPEQVVSLNPVQIQLTNSQYDVLSNTKFFTVDVSQLGMESGFYTLSTDSIIDNQFVFTDPAGNTTNLIMIDKTTKIAEYITWDIVSTGSVFSDDSWSKFWVNKIPIDGDSITINSDGELQVANSIPAPPISDGEYNLHCSIVNGVVTYTWELQS